MRFLLWHSLAVTACAAALGNNLAAEDRGVPVTTSKEVKNANHVFNAVRGAMRQWDSSWNHNGMSFFLAEVPGGLQLYHGTTQEEAIDGMEWLAFEPEHALMFAHGLRPPHGPRKGRDGRPDKVRSQPRSEQEVLRSDEAGRPHCPHPPPPRDDDPHGGSPPPPPPHLGGPPEGHGQPRGPPPLPPHHGRNPSPRRPADLPPTWPPLEALPPRSDGEEETYQDRQPYGVVDRHGSVGNKHQPIPAPSSPHGDCEPWAYGPAPVTPPPLPPHDHECQNIEQPSFHSSKQPGAPHEAGHPRPPPPPGRDLNDTGYLHIYRTLHPLHLLLIDGMSAGKTAKGTLDSQDYILWADGIDNNSSRPPFLDGIRAAAMCNLTRDEWESKVDGFIRMEAGFEIILCNFSAHLHLERAQKVKHDDDAAHGLDLGFQYFRAIADRYHGIGGERANIDFANMVSAFNTDMKLFVNDSVISRNLIPRLQNQSTSDLAKLQDAIGHMIVHPAPKSDVNWQSIADMLVQRYADPLQYLASSDTSDDDFALILGALMRPFISDAEENHEAKVQRCVDQVIPQSRLETLAGRAVHEVSSTLCSVLVAAVTEVTGHRKGVTKARNDIESLIEYLDWPIWHECKPSCAINEVCVIPIWPLTRNVEDRVKPKCKNITEFDKQQGPGPGRGHSDEDDYWHERGESWGPPSF